MGKTTEKEFLPLQPGDVYGTYADVKDLVEQFDYKPSTNIEEGITNYINWYKQYHESVAVWLGKHKWRDPPKDFL